MKPLGAQISHALKDRGVDVIFGIPGVHNVEMYRGIEEAGIKHVLARHEQGAGFMADGYARATGKPGVAYVITGPGVCNIMTPMGQAYSDSSPLLVLSSCLERKDRSLGRGRLHEMLDQEGAAATVCDWSVTAPDEIAAYRLIDKAFTEFASSRPLTKHIQVPIDVLGGMAEAAPKQGRLPEKPRASMALVKEVAELLQAAKRPLFVFGGGSKSGSDAARQIVGACNAACFMTYAGKGVIASNYPLNYGSYLGRPASEDVIASADLVVVVGSALSECDLWRDHLGNKAPMVRVDIDAHCLADDHRAQYPIKGDARAFLDDLAKALGDHQGVSSWKKEDVVAAKAAFKAATDSERPYIVPLIDVLADVLPAETTIVSDMTQFAYVGKEVYPIDMPNRWHHPTGFGTLGYALPASIGAKVGIGDAPVVAIAGDYGFQYTAQELGAAVELGLSLPIIVWDNGKLKEIEDSMVRSQIAPNAVIAHNPDFVALAKAYGANAVAPRSIKAFQTAITDALIAKGPTVIHITPDTSMIA